MSSLRLTGSFSSSSSVALANNAVSGQGDIVNAAGFFSSLLDQIRSEANGNSGQQGLSAALSGVVSNSSSHAGTSLQEISSSWKSFLSTWSSKLKSNNTTTSSSHAPQSGHVAQESDSSTSAARDSSDPSKSPARTSSGTDSSVQNRNVGNSSCDNTQDTKQQPRCVSSNQDGGQAVANETSSDTDADVDNEATKNQSEGDVSDALSSLFAELQALMAQLQQRLQNMNGASASTDCTDDGDANAIEDTVSSYTDLDESSLVADNQGDDNVSELLDASAQDVVNQTDASSASGQDSQVTEDIGDMLKDLLDLAKTLDDKLGLSRDPTESASENSSSSEQIGHQLAHDLKSVAESLKATLATSEHVSTSTPVHSASSGTLDQTDISATPDSESSSDLRDPAANLVTKALTTAEHVIAQLSHLSQADGDASQQQARQSTSVFGSSDTLHALFSGSQGTGGDGLDSNSSGQQGGFSSGNLPSGTAGTTSIPTGAEGVKGSSNSYSFANQLASLRSASSGLTTLSSPTEQVIVHLHRTLASGDNRLSIQLNPTDLGRIDIKLDMASDGKVQGTVVVSNPSTLDMLQKDARGLERALQEAGLQADPGSLNFSLGGQQQDGSSRQAAQNGGFGASGSARSVSSSQDDNGTQPDIPEVSETWVVSPNRVNVRI